VWKNGVGGERWNGGGDWRLGGGRVDWDERDWRIGGIEGEKEGEIERDF
jgi:hypothetical protein